MTTKIVFAVLCVLMIAAGVFGWWIENGRSSGSRKKDKDVSEDDTKDVEGIKKDEENKGNLHHRTGKRTAGKHKHYTA